MGRDFMAKLQSQSIGFDEELSGGIEAYAERKGISFSKATTELASAGLNLFRTTESLNPEILKHKVRDQEERIKILTESFDMARKEIDRLWSLIGTGTVKGVSEESTGQRQKKRRVSKSGRL